MFSTTVVILISLCAVQVLAVDENCPNLYNGSLIENCCNLGYKLLTFSESINQPKVYKLKNFCNKNCTTIIINGYCDTLTDGGGWLVVQRRTNGLENFHRNWNDYEKGFGRLTGELWYGLHALHCLTQQGKWELRIDFTFNNGTKSFMHYNNFKVGPSSDNYRLNISGFTGITPTDPFVRSNGQQFTTYDRDNDPYHGNCALHAHGGEAGGWWHNQCNQININFNYKGKSQFGFMLLGNKWYSPHFIESKIRPSNCNI